MKKAIFCFICMLCILCICMSYASAYSSIPMGLFEAIDKDNASTPVMHVDVSPNGTFQKNDYNDGGRRCISYDGIDYTKLASRNYGQIAYKVGNRFVQLEGVPVGLGRPISNGPLHIYDENFGEIATKRFDGRIRKIYETKGFSCLYFELELLPNGEIEIYKTEDGEEWELCDGVDEQAILKPLSQISPIDGTFRLKDFKGIYTYTTRDLKNVLFSCDDMIAFDVAFERERDENNDSNLFSPDGIYSYQVPFEEYTFWKTADYIYFDTYDSYYRIPESYFNHTYITFGDKLLAFEETPKMDSGRILVPMRFLFEQMGGEVGWNPTLRIASFITKQNTVDFPIGSKTATVNGVQEEMDVAARIINNKTYIPLRFLSESLGYNVEWDAQTRTAHISVE